MSLENKNRQEFRELLADVYSFYEKTFTKFAMGVWWQAMKPFDFDAVRHALSKHSTTPGQGKYLPKPADIIEIIEGSREDRSLVAWTKVEKAIRTVGPYSSVVFDDPNIHIVIVELGGWINLCKVDNKELPFKRNEFVKRYQAVILSGRYIPCLLCLAGIYELANGLGRPELNQIKFIGDRVACEAIFSSGEDRKKNGNRAIFYQQRIT